MFDDEEPKEWDTKDEEPPERLQKKWEREEVSTFQRVVCPSCKKEVPSGNLTCIFCGAVIMQDKCPLGCFWGWLKELFKRP
jgi:ribosomal protein S27E